MKLVELLIVLMLLITAFVPLYKTAKGYESSARNALEKFNTSQQSRIAKSIVKNMKAYGEPFEYKEFKNLEGLGLKYDSINNQYIYETYSRW